MKSIAALIINSDLIDMAYYSKAVLVPRGVIHSNVSDPVTFLIKFGVKYAIAEELWLVRKSSEDNRKSL